MNVYLISITADIPYPWGKHYFEKASGEGPAVSRGLKRFRQDLRERFGRAKQLREFEIKVQRVRLEEAETTTTGERGGTNDDATEEKI